MTRPAASLYVGRVFHGRLRPVHHGFTYRVFSVLFDIDRLAETAAGSRLFSLDRFNLLSFHRNDHGARDQSALRPWIEARLAENGMAHLGGQRIEILCFPRLWGFVFNPLSIYFVGDGEVPAAIVYEVKNTFGEQHAYVLRAGTGEAQVAHEADKTFHVSPFMSLDLRYRFRLRRPDETLSVAIDTGDDDGPVMRATWSGRRLAFTDKNLFLTVLAHPLMTVKVFAAIHWEALRLWLKGAPFYRKPTAAEDPVP